MNECGTDWPDGQWADQRIQNWHQGQMRVGRSTDQPRPIHPQFAFSPVKLGSGLNPTYTPACVWSGSEAVPLPDFLNHSNALTHFLHLLVSPCCLLSDSCPGVLTETTISRLHTLTNIKQCKPKSSELSQTWDCCSLFAQAHWEPTGLWLVHVLPDLFYRSLIARKHLFFIN